MQRRWRRSRIRIGKPCSQSLAATSMHLIQKGRIPYHLAVAFENNKFLCWATNSPGIHAEQKLIQNLMNMDKRYNMKWSKITVYVLRVKFDADKNAYYSLSKPCIECTKALRKVNVRNVCWSVGGNMFESCRPCDLRSHHLSRKYRSYQ